MNDNDIYCIWLSLKKHMDCSRKNLLCGIFGGVRALYEASPGELEQCFEAYETFARCGAEALDELKDKDLKSSESVLENLEAVNGVLIHQEEPEFPGHLREISDCPVLLYCRGNAELLNKPGIAVVGTRRSSPYGRWAASEIAKRIARSGTTVISGMAEGIDSAGQLACLNAGGSTIAVLGTGVDICFPRSNRVLYQSIIEKGLVLSEYPPGTPGYASNFPRRNRIISGLSRAVIVVEGARKSGSMITAGLAAEHGRDVFAVPGNINQPNSIGVNALIADGACPIMDLDELNVQLGLGSAIKAAAANLSREELSVMELIRLNPGISVSKLLERCGCSAGHMMSLVSGMELKGVLRIEGGRLYISN